MSQVRERFDALRLKLAPYSFASTLIGWDARTEAPLKSAPYRAKMLSALMGDYFGLFYNPANIELLNEFLQLNDLSPVERVSAQEMLRSIAKMKDVPQELMVEMQQHTSLSQQVWEEAKAKSDFALFAPYLEKSIELKKKSLQYRSHPSGLAYNVLLDDFEPGMTMEKYDAFFDALRRDLIPFVRSIHQGQEQIDDTLLTEFYPREEQKKYVEYLIGVMRFDTERGLMKTSVHPFTTGTSTDDVRFTVRYMEKYLPASIFAGIHEMGHALHFQQGNPEYNMYMLPFGLALGESQSRFYENFIGRSLAFWQTHFAKLQEIFPQQMAGQTAESFWRIINRSKPTMTRVEADELTYPMHIMLRYEIERDLFAADSSLKVADLPEIWNAKMKEYLGIVPATHAEGVLQDSHWSGASFGYFPTYALGTAYSAQIFDTMKQNLDIDALVRGDRMEEINAWLADKIHREGNLCESEELLKMVTGEALNPDHFVNYLKDKYSQVYKLS